MIKDKHWKERENINRNIKRDEELARAINKSLNELKDTIQREINNELERYASNEGINTSEAYKRASKFDIELYRKRAKKLSKRKDFSPRANYELRLYNLKMRMSRLELIKANIGLELIATFDELERFLSKEMNKDAKRELERQYIILKVLGFFDNGDAISMKNTIEPVVNGSYHNATFSDRIWQYQTELKLDLEKLLTRAITGGYNPRKIAIELRNKFDVTKSNAERLMRTEQARIQGELQTTSYKKYGVKEYDIITEPSACKVCKGVAKDGPYKVGKEDIGVNMIPLHPNCRCSSVPVSSRKEMEEDFKRRGL